MKNKDSKTDKPCTLHGVKRSLLDKIAWVADYMKKEKFVDVLNAEFVDAYINEFSAMCRITNYGANKCPELGKTLKAGYDNGTLERGRVGLTCHEQGFPNWVYVYELNCI